MSGNQALIDACRLDKGIEEVTRIADNGCSLDNVDVSISLLNEGLKFQINPFIINNVIIKH